jgi:hypothetical protein
MPFVVIPERLKPTDFEWFYASLIGQLAKAMKLNRCPGKPGNSDAYCVFLASACYMVNLRGRVTLGLDPFRMECSKKMLKKA